MVPPAEAQNEHMTGNLEHHLNGRKLGSTLNRPGVGESGNSVKRTSLRKGIGLKITKKTQRIVEGFEA